MRPGAVREPPRAWGHYVHHPLSLTWVAQTPNLDVCNPQPFAIYNNQVVLHHFGAGSHARFIAASPY